MRMYGKTLRLKDRDLDLTNNQLHFITGTEKIGQDLSIILMTEFGEDPFDPSYGFKFMDLDQFDPQLIRQRIRKALGQHQNVKAVSDIVVSLDQETRSVSISANVELEDGTTLVVTL